MLPAVRSGFGEEVTISKKKSGFMSLNLLNAWLVSEVTA